MAILMAQHTMKSLMYWGNHVEWAPYFIYCVVVYSKAFSCMGTILGLLSRGQAFFLTEALVPSKPPGASCYLPRHLPGDLHRTDSLAWGGGHHLAGTEAAALTCPLRCSSPLYVTATRARSTPSSHSRLHLPHCLFLQFPR